MVERVFKKKGYLFALFALEVFLLPSSNRFEEVKVRYRSREWV